MAKTIKSPIALRTRSQKNTAIAKKKNICAVTVSLVRLSQSQVTAAMANGLIDSPKYNLRKRIKVEKSPKKKKKSAVSNVVSSLDQMPAARLWTILKNQNNVKIEKDLCCLAKMRSYSPWPAMVLESDNKTTKVYFFGEGTSGKVSTNEIVPFEKCLGLATKYFKINGYKRAVREMELMKNIPHHLSITKNI